MSRKFVKQPSTVAANTEVINAGQSVNPNLREDVYLAVVAELNRTLANLPEVVASTVEGYEVSYNDASGTHQPEIDEALQELAGEVMYQMLLDCPFRAEFF